MKSRLLYIHTFGCQMNVYDSDRIAGLLMPSGYTCAPSVESADLIVVNTCAIRAKAEQKLYSFLGRLAGLKRRKPGLLIGVGGCVAQQQGASLLAQARHVDFVFGTQALPRLPFIVEQAAAGGKPVLDVAMDSPSWDFAAPAATGGVGPTRFVTIMQGCDNFCSYCVVPYVRGPEASRPPRQIVAEVRGLVRRGVREVTLLGQNVNSYGRKEGLCSFVKLLEEVSAVEGLRRIRFTTSHPKDLTGELMQAFERLDKLCPHLHLPVQSGSNRILKRMKRGYTRERYLEKLERLRSCCPGIAVTSDVIVGFPGEDRSDFHQTLDLLERAAFDGLFAFAYSDRPQAAAARFTDKVAEGVKLRRLRTLLDQQEGITLEKNRQQIGCVHDVLLEGVSKKQAKAGPSNGRDGVQWTGRTATNKIVNLYLEKPTIPDAEGLIGEIIDVRIEKAFPHSLWGRPLFRAAAPRGSEGGERCAA
jgi:tRNA-2-methylthio-N6-dimethylallyladenosine synthase